MNGGVKLWCCVVVMVMAVPLMAQGRGLSGFFAYRLARRNERAWTQWKKTFGKVYSPMEEEYRRKVFSRNLQHTLRHNARYPQTVAFTRGVNQFSDMTLREYRAYNGLTPSRSWGQSQCVPVKNDPRHDASLPDTVDWRTKGYVTAVKNQGQCASGWAFSTTGTVEGQYFNQTGELVPLSEQQLIDCSLDDQNCDGGWMDPAFAFLIYHTQGLETEEDYPYTAKDGNCTAKPSKERAKITSCYDLPEGDEQALKRAVARVGPVSVAIDASQPSFQSYNGGVYYDQFCKTSDLDHGVLVVGYGTYQGEDYWLVKNSWGTDWGMKGYIMMSRNRDNNCGIASKASYPLS